MATCEGFNWPKYGQAPGHSAEITCRVLDYKGTSQDLCAACARHQLAQRRPNGKRIIVKFYQLKNAALADARMDRAELWW